MDPESATRLGVYITESQRPVTLAGGIPGEANEGFLDIQWFDQDYRVHVYVLRKEFFEVAPRQLIPPEREILLGTRLMKPGKLTVDFFEGVVRLTK